MESDENVILGINDEPITYEEMKLRANALWQEVLDRRAREQAQANQLDREAV